MELFVVDGPDAGRSFALGPDSVIGRDPTSTVHLTDEEVSRRHALVSIGEGRAIVEDLGSSNGIYLNDVIVQGQAPLRSGDKLRLGSTILEVRELEGSEDPEELKATKTSLRPPPPR